MGVKSFWRRLKSWCRQDVASYLYQCSTISLCSTAPPLLPGLQPCCYDRANLAREQRLLHNLPPVIEQRVAQGNLAILAVKGQEWIFRSAAVLGPRTYSVTGYPLALQADEAYLECAETVPAWRGKGIAPGMLRPTAETLLARGVTRVYLLIGVQNTASCRAAEKGGASRLGLITSRRRFGQWTSSFQEHAARETIPFTARA